MTPPRMFVFLLFVSFPFHCVFQEATGHYAFGRALVLSAGKPAEAWRWHFSCFRALFPVSLRQINIPLKNTNCSVLLYILLGSLHSTFPQSPLRTDYGSLGEAEVISPADKQKKAVRVTAIIMSSPMREPSLILPHSSGRRAGLPRR